MTIKIDPLPPGRPPSPIPPQPLPRPRMYRPAGLSVTCDAYDENPRRGEPGQPHLLRCRKHSARRITYQTAVEVITIKRCDCHAAELRALDKAGRIEILEDEPVKERIGA